MFQKSTFGNTSTGFGSFNAGASTSSPFGGFKPATGSTFGATSAFGATATPQAAPAGGLFGASNTSTGLFGGTTSTAAPAFGASQPSAFGFGAAAPSGGLFGNTSTTGGGLFGGTQQNASAFGAKPTGFGFGSTPTTAGSTGVFGSTTTGGGLFGQTNTMSGGGMFGGTTGFGVGQQATGTGHVKFAPVPGTDVVVKGGSSQNVSIKHHCITCMKEYEAKSLEELRLEDYQAGRKGGGATAFGGIQENKSLFGGTVSAFGQPATTSAPTVFGGGGLGNTSFGQTNTFAFGNTAANTSTTGGLFGANKPAFPAANTTGTGLFGATSTQAPTFGTTTSTFGFGTAQPQQQTTGLFGTTGSAFGQTANTSFGGGGLFGAKPSQATTLTTAPAFGATSSAFGTNTSTSGSLFGGTSTFGAKPVQPSFGFGATQPTLGTGLGSAFQQKPAGGLSLSNPGTGLFSGTNTLGGTNFNTGNTTLGGGLGAFGNTSTLGGSTLGGGLGGFGTATNNLMPGNNNLSSSVPSNVHEQILALVARPYGDSPLYKDLPDSTTTAEEALKPTNPAALKAVVDGATGYRVTSPDNIPLRLRPSAPIDKKSLFDGLEEADASLDNKLSLKPSRKRLVLRPQQNRPQNDTSNVNRSTEEPVPARTSPVTEAAPTSLSSPRNEDLRGINTDLEQSSEKHGSWLGSSRLSWSNSKEKINNDSPRIYPNLDKELPSDVSDRRASWLTTKPLHKPVTAANAGAVEDSVAELHTEPRSNQDKENIELAVSEDENVSPQESAPHPTGVKLTRPGYYTIPTLDDMIGYIGPDGRCVLPHLTIGRKNYGNVFFDCEIDVTGLDLDNLVHFLNKEIVIYPEDSDKPPVGCGLNRRAIVTLDRVWPRDKTDKRLITDPHRLMKMDYEGRLRRVCDKHDTKFIEYRPQTGSWVFRVEHFSKYGLTDSDEEDDITPEVLKRQLVKETLQNNAAPAQQQLALPRTGLGGLASPNDVIFHTQSALNGSAINNNVQLNQTGLGLMQGAGMTRVFEMDTTDENPDMHSMYPEVNRAYGVKSPTSELARLENRHSHSVQLMKASLYADAELEDDVSVSTLDQLVPQPSSVTSQPVITVSAGISLPEVDREEHVVSVTEPVLRPLIVPPHTVVLKYHRKIPPFKRTIAGKLGASTLASMAVSRARHFRVGFGASNTLVYNTTQDVAEYLPKSGALTTLHRFVSGRGENDWSSQCVIRLGIGQGGPSNNVEEAMTAPIEALLQYSTVTEHTDIHTGHAQVRSEASQRRELLDMFTRHSVPQLAEGVTNNYYQEVWKLCEALWAHDLENGGVPSTSEESVVLRHGMFLQWLVAAVADETDRELSQPIPAEQEDDTDTHSARVLTLLLGGRVTEACQVARQNGDVNMAALIAQAAGDSTFRSLLNRQLTLWRSCGALDFMAKSRVDCLTLLAGLPPNCLADRGWLVALYAVAKYMCDQVPSLEQVVTRYESLLEQCPELPRPARPGFDATVETGETSRRILDFRYELIRARALNVRPKLQPECYTHNPFDYTLCFLVSAWLGQLTPELSVGLARQLSSANCWHLATAVLAYHSNDTLRSHLIREYLSRHCPAQITTDRQRKQMSFLRRVNVPPSWISEAAAYRAMYEKLPSVAAEHLVAAGKWNMAHRLLMDELLPEAALNDNLDSLSPIVTALSKAAENNQVYGWNKGGLALGHYLHVAPTLLSASLGTLPGFRLESLRSQLAQALVACKPPQQAISSPRKLAAFAELSTRLSRLLQACGADTLPRAPPDATNNHALQIARHLAEEASEACAETSAPIAAN